MVAEGLEADEAAFVAEMEERLAPVAAYAVRCPPPATLQAGVQNGMPPALAAAVRAHVERCTICSGLQRDLQALPVVELTDLERQRIRRRVFAQPTDRAVRTGSRALWTAIAGAGAIAASLVLASMFPQTVLPSPLQAPRLAPAALERPSVLQVDKPPLQLPLSALVSLRGAADHRADTMMLGLARYQANDFRGAAELLARAIPSPAVPRAPLYLAVSYLQTGDAAGAERTLTAARATAAADVAADLDWYLAIAHVQLGQRVRAAEELDALCAGSGDVAARACAGAMELKR